MDIILQYLQPFNAILILLGFRGFDPTNDTPLEMRFLLVRTTLWVVLLGIFLAIYG